MSRADARGGLRQSATLAALGVVFGDIGTSPLYALRQCFTQGAETLPIDRLTLFGVLSVMFWALVVVISIEYIIFVLRADNDGEGGVLALTALVVARTEKHQRWRDALTMLGLIGASLLFADAMITPAISVLSAVEGLQVQAPVLAPYVIPLTLTLLSVLYLTQRFGTGRIGAIFGPVIALWFASMGAIGCASIVKTPEVLAAMNPWYGLRLFFDHGFTAFLVMSAVFLVVTGGESLYADMGHFGRRPIRRAWFMIVLPGLVLNYFGQAALLLRSPEALDHLFFAAVPGWALYPMVGLATIAAMTASQSVISGAFSVASTAVQLGFLPRLSIRQTSSDVRGQIYVPAVNWIFMFGTLALVLLFQRSTRLAAAYGVAVSTTMLVTTLFLYFVARHVWLWSRPRAAALMLPFVTLNLLFFSSNLGKIPAGGWMPALIAVAVFLIMDTWRQGRAALYRAMDAEYLNLDLFISSIELDPPVRVGGLAIFLTGSREGAPRALLHNIKHNRILHERVVLLTVTTARVPFVAPARRVEYVSLGQGISRMVLTYGFMERPNLPRDLRSAQVPGFVYEEMEATFFLGRESILVAPGHGWVARMRAQMFALLTRNATNAAKFFRLPPNRVIEIGAQIEI